MTDDNNNFEDNLKCVVDEGSDQLTFSTVANYPRGNLGKIVVA